MSALALRGHTALNSILLETLFLDQLYDFSLLSLDLLLHQFSKLKFMKKIPFSYINIYFNHLSLSA